MTIHYTDLNHKATQATADSTSMHRLELSTLHHANLGTGLYRNVFKRVIDVMLLLLAAPVFVPLILLLALLVWLKTGTTPFYTQARVGKNGRIFTMWKLRTMVMDADEKLAAYLEADPSASEEWDRDQKLKNDPRVTSVGRMLRRTSMDELPQLWNVFRGEMSLIGPRPMMENQKPLYPGLDYYDLRPGITGLWQTSKRNDASFAQRAWFDNQYNRELSPLNDAAILINTFAVVCRGTGY